MFLKNYTSEVPVSQTIYRIEQVLIKCQVTGITKEYATNGVVIALQFHIPAFNGTTVTVRLPADVKKAVDALWLNYADGDKLTPDGTRLAWGGAKKKTRKDFIEQGERTAWKIMQDWVEVQMSMIQMQQAETLEVFLPYIWNDQLKETVYTRIKSGGFRALLPESTQ